MANELEEKKFEFEELAEDIEIEIPKRLDYTFNKAEVLENPVEKTILKVRNSTYGYQIGLNHDNTMESISWLGLNKTNQRYLAVNLGAKVSDWIGKKVKVWTTEYRGNIERGITAGFSVHLEIMKEE